MNLRTVFAQADAFDALPVFPFVDGTLGEFLGQKSETQTYLFGMKLKLNGKVTNSKLPSPKGGFSSFDYHLELLRGKDQADADQLAMESPTQRQRRLMRLVRSAILYYVVFSKHDDPFYDPLPTLESKILPTLREASVTAPGGQEAVDRLFCTIADGCQRYQANVDKLVAGLHSLLQQKTLAPKRTWDVCIGVHRGIVEDRRSSILDEGHPLRPVFAEDRKEYLAYLEVADGQTLSGALFRLDAQITFEDIQCFAVDNVLESWKADYETQGLALLPVFLSLALKRSQNDLLTLQLKPPYKPGLSIACYVQSTKEKPIYREHPVLWFIYRYVVTIIAYLGIHLLASYHSKGLFISVTRVHQQNREDGNIEDQEGFLAMLSKVLAQVLGEDYLANAQGLHEQHLNTKYIKDNAAASLYSPLPKIFTFPTPLPSSLPRLALVVVSSRESDSLSKGRNPRRQRRSTVYGEAVDIESLSTTTIRVRRIETFSDTYPYQELYTNPTVIPDLIHRLYQQGHRHIFYIAQAPYSSTLHITQKERDPANLDPEREGLFFLSTEILKRCAHDGLHIYPIFREQYHAMKLVPSLGANTLYIQDLAELTHVVNAQDQRQMVVFLNLFSGQTVGHDNREKYNGVVSYATLLNIYQDILDERHLWKALIQDDDGKNELKNMLVLYLTLFHLSRYEARKQEIAIKLDPFEHIIGDTSIGKIALRQHADPHLIFNFLAFLSDVRRAIKPVQGKQGNHD